MQMKIELDLDNFKVITTDKNVKKVEDLKVGIIPKFKLKKES